MDTNMTELEERLAQPDGESLSEALQVRLAGIAERLQMQLSASVPRSEFPDWQASADAVAAAQEVLRGWATGKKDRS